MPIWNNNDREESKPTWLNKSQKINCVRTVSGWELPLHGTSLGANFDGLKLYNGAGFGATGMTNSVPSMELLVSMPMDPVYDPNLVVSLTGVYKDFHFGTSVTGFSLTAGNQLYYYDQNTSGAPFTVGSTAGIEAIASIVAATAAAGSFTVQLNGFFNPTKPGSFGGPKDVETNGIFLSMNSSTTGSTASVSSVVGIIDGIYSTNSFYANRIVATGGATSGLGWNGDSPNYRPYLTVPFNGDSSTGGGWDGLGLSFGTTAAYDRVAGVAVAGGTGFGFYAVNKRGGGTLNFPGATAYIKVIANDSNFTQNISFTLPTVLGANQQFGASALIYQGAQLVNGTIPMAVYDAFFGPTATVNNNIAVVQVLRSGATANNSYKMTVRATDNGTGGLTADSTFTISFGAAANG
jgi:hypothetical protein